MKLSLTNAFYQATAKEEIKIGRFVDKVVLSSPTPDFYKNDTKIDAYFCIDEKGDIDTDKVCLSSLLLSDRILDKTIDYVLTNKCKFMVRACENLYESGLIESKYKLSPIMLLHRMGLLDNATIIGANHIDRDDIDLMAQCNASVVFLPSYSMGKGNGIAPITFAMGKLPIALGTADNSYNGQASMLFESKLALLCANAEMRKENAIDTKKLLSFVGKGNENEFKKLILD